MVLCLQLTIFGQNKPSYVITEYSDFPNEFTNRVNCTDANQNSNKAQRDELVNSEVEIISNIFEVNRPVIKYFNNAIMGGTARAFVTRSECPGTEGKVAVLLGHSLWDANTKLVQMTELQELTISIVILAHEIAHIKQAGIENNLKAKEKELHADFMAGWYLAQSEKLKRVTDKNTVMATAVY